MAVTSLDRSVAVAMFGNSYEVDYGAALPHFQYSDFMTASDLDGIADRWVNRPKESKLIRVYECLGPRRSGVYEGWNKFFHDIFSAPGDVSVAHLTKSVIDHAAGAFERARKARVGLSYKRPSLFSRLLSDGSVSIQSESNRLFSDLSVEIVSLPEKVCLSDHSLAPGDKIYHLLSSNILKGTRIVEYTVRDRHLSASSWAHYSVKYTALRENSTMPLHFELSGGSISMASYGDCTSAYSSGPLFLTLEEAKRAEAAIWEEAQMRLNQYVRENESL